MAVNTLFALTATKRVMTLMANATNSLLLYLKIVKFYRVSYYRRHCTRKDAIST